MIGNCGPIIIILWGYLFGTDDLFRQYWKVVINPPSLQLMDLLEGFSEFILMLLLLKLQLSFFWAQVQWAPIWFYMN